MFHFNGNYAWLEIDLGILSIFLITKKNLVAIKIWRR